MTAKILKENGQVIHLSTYCPLNEVETTDAGELAKQAAFDKCIKEMIEKPITQGKLKLLDGDTLHTPITLTLLTISQLRVREHQGQKEKPPPCWKNWITMWEHR